jgi:hypothetical protein
MEGERSGHTSINTLSAALDGGQAQAAAPKQWRQYFAALAGIGTGSNKTLFIK